MERKPKRSAAIALLSLVLLIAYPLSAGPVFFCGQQVYRREPRIMKGFLRAYFTVYGPLMDAPEPIGSASKRWIDLWFDVVD